MRYIDTGSRDPERALGAWLQRLAPRELENLRLQSGYFNSGGIAPLVPHLEHIAAQDLPISIVVGSNEGETSADHVGILLDLIGAPRERARVAILRYDGGLFHSKVFHIKRVDGSQAAYVGSANLTGPGVDGTNIESGVVLDTRDGDAEQPLSRIASDIDAWFGGTRRVSIVGCRDELPPLVIARVLGQRPSRNVTRSAASAGPGDGSAHRLTRLMTFPSLPTPGGSAAGPPRYVSTAGSGTAESASHASGQGTSIPRDGFPAYVLFAPQANEPTEGTEALSGSTLPGDTAGIIVRLNNDSARHFLGKPGTANVSVPVATVSTLRFGIYSGAHDRPRCEFRFRTRFIHPGGVYMARDFKTNIMVYGHIDGESGHGDVRMLIPRSATRDVSELIAISGSRLPAPNDPMIVEWPTPSNPTVRVTFADQRLPLFDELAAQLDAAELNRELVGRGACWLPDDLSPFWTS